MVKKRSAVRRSVVAGLLFVDLVAFAAWLVSHPDRYDSVARVVQGEWAAFLAFAVAIGLRLKRKQPTSIAAFLEDPGVTTIIAIASVIIAGAAACVALDAAPIHAVELRVSGVAPAAGNPAVRLRSQHDTNAITLIGRGPQQERMARGHYTAVTTATGYLTDTSTVNLDWFTGLWAPVSVEVGLRPVEVRGQVQVRGYPDGATVQVRDVAGSLHDALRATRLPEVTFSLPPGRYVVSESASGFKSDSATVVIAAGDIVQVQLRAEQKRVQGDLVLMTKPVVAEAEIDGRLSGRTPIRVRIDTGRHEVILRARRDGGRGLLERFAYVETLSVDVRGGRQTSKTLEFARAIALPRLRIAPVDTGARYFLDVESDSTFYDPVNAPGGVYVYPGWHRLIRRVGAERSTLRVFVVRDTTVSY